MHHKLSKNTDAFQIMFGMTSVDIQTKWELRSVTVSSHLRGSASLFEPDPL